MSKDNPSILEVTPGFLESVARNNKEIVIPKDFKIHYGIPDKEDINEDK